MANVTLRQGPSGPPVTLSDDIVAPGELLGRSLNEVSPGIAVPVTGAQQGEMIRYQNEATNVDTGTLALLTISSQVTSIQFNPVGSDLVISAISIPFGKECNLRVQRGNAQRVILTNGSGATGIRCPGNADYVMRANDECTVISSFGGTPMVIDKASDPHLLAPETAFAGNPTTFFANTFELRNTFAAGGGGAADDVILLNANAPFAFRILDCWLETSAAVVGASVTLRNATGGGGAAVSSALSAAAGNTTSRNSVGVTSTIAINGSLVARRSDSAVAGTIVVLCART